MFLIEKRKNIENFMNAYRDNVRSISKVTMIHKMGEIEEDLLDADICWMVTDNIEELLAIGNLQKEEIIRKGDVNKLKKFLTEELNKNRLIIIYQGVDEGEDHWFAVVGDGELSYIIEHTPDICNYYEVWYTPELIEEISDIQSGIIPDRFYKEKKYHSMNAYSYDRKNISEDLIYDRI